MTCGATTWSSGHSPSPIPSPSPGSTFSSSGTEPPSCRLPPFACGPSASPGQTSASSSASCPESFARSSCARFTDQGPLRSQEGWPLRERRPGRCLPLVLVLLREILKCRRRGWGAMGAIASGSGLDDLSPIHEAARAATLHREAIVPAPVVKWASASDSAALRAEAARTCPFFHGRVIVPNPASPGERLKGRSSRTRPRPTTTTGGLSAPATRFSYH